MLAFERVDDVLELGRKGVHIGELGLDDFRVVQPPHGKSPPRPGVKREGRLFERDVKTLLKGDGRHGERTALTGDRHSEPVVEVLSVDVDPTTARRDARGKDAIGHA